MATVTGEQHTYHHVLRFLPDGEPQNLGTEEITLTYAARWVISPANVRNIPTRFGNDPVTVLSKGAKVDVFAEPVTPRILDVLGVSATIDDNYLWHYIYIGQHKGKFIAGSLLSATQSSPPPTTPPPNTPPSVPGSVGPPMPLDGMKGLHLQTIGGKTFLRGGQYMGVNLRECIYWGHPNIAPYMRQADWDKYFQFLAERNIRWVRCYVLNTNATLADTKARMRAMLDRAKVHGIRVCAVFMDSIGDELNTGAKHRFNLKSLRDSNLHSGPMGHLTKEVYHRNLLLGEFLNLVKEIVTEFRNHEALCMWEPINEPAIHPQPATQADADAMERNLYAITKEIYNLDKSTPIGSGFIATNQFCPQGVDLRTYARAFWAKMRYIHVYSGHVYQDKNNLNGPGAGEGNIMIDMEEAQRSGHGTGLGEKGRIVPGDGWLRGLMDRMFIQGSASFLWQWALELPPFDKGIGDNIYGWGTKVHNDFDALGTAFVEMGNRLRSR